MLIVALGIIGFLSFAVAVLPAARLAQLIALYMTAQNVIQVGKAGTTKLPSNEQWIGEFFNSVSILNFDIESVG
jgi:hypothetical protein